MKQTASELITRLRGKTLVTAESLTGGGIGEVLTRISGASAVYKGGIISYSNEIKRDVLGVPEEILKRYGAVSSWTAGYMASGARKLLKADYAVSVTGLAGPGGDEFGNIVGTVFIGYEDAGKALVKKYHFSGDREAVRNQTIEAAMQLVLENL